MENQEQENLHNQGDVNPGSELEKIILEKDDDKLPITEGTGGNKPVQTESSVVIKDDLTETDSGDK